jgi:hypothetical protein
MEYVRGGDLSDKIVSCYHGLSSAILCVVSVTKFGSTKFMDPDKDLVIVCMKSYILELVKCPHSSLLLPYGISEIRVT